LLWWRLRGYTNSLHCRIRVRHEIPVKDQTHRNGAYIRVPPVDSRSCSPFRLNSVWLSLTAARLLTLLDGKAMTLHCSYMRNRSEAKGAVDLCWRRIYGKLSMNDCWGGRSPHHSVNPWVFVFMCFQDHDSGTSTIESTPTALRRALGRRVLLFVGCLLARKVIYACGPCSLHPSDLPVQLLEAESYIVIVES